MPRLNTLPEHELLKRLRSGDRDAFTEIYNRYWERLLATGYYYTHDKQTAEDIVHDVMISLWTRKEELTIASLPAYLGTAVKFAVFKSIARNKKRRDLLAGRGEPEPFSDIEEKLDARFLQEYLQCIVEQLPEKARMVFTYSRVAELTPPEIAEKMGLSPKAVEYHITRALRTIRHRLRKFFSFFL